MPLCRQGRQVCGDAAGGGQKDSLSGGAVASGGLCARRGQHGQLQHPGRDHRLWVSIPFRSLAALTWPGYIGVCKRIIIACQDTLEILARVLRRNHVWFVNLYVAQPCTVSSCAPGAKDKSRSCLVRRNPPLCAHPNFVSDCFPWMIQWLQKVSHQWRSILMCLLCNSGRMGSWSALIPTSHPTQQT